MIVRQYLRTDPVVAASYLFGCGGEARGAVGPSGYTGVTEGELDPGNVRLRVLHTPGHIPPRPERLAEIPAENLGHQPAAR